MPIRHLRLIHLYGDILNTYGDGGNIAALKFRARQRGVELDISLLGIGSKLAPEEADLYFFGGGQDAGQEVVSADIGKWAELIKNSVESGVPLLSICGGYQLLGQSYTTSSGRQLPGLGVLPVETVAGNTRMMHNVVAAINPQLSIDRSVSSMLVGFENHSGKTRLLPGAQSLGRIVKGSGNNGTDGTEGVVYKHAIGTYLHGSCLPKNPHLADWLLAKALEHRYGDGALMPLDDELEWQAHRAAIGLKA